MANSKKATTTAILSLLILCYGFVIYCGVRNTLDFLYRQQYYRNILFSSFYGLCLLVCLARIAEYAYLISTYFTGQGSDTFWYFVLDVVSNTLMIMVGIILVLKIMNVTAIFSRIIGIQRSLPNIPLLMCMVLMLTVAAVSVTSALWF